MTLDAVSVACPVYSRDDEVVAALSLVVHADGAQPLTLMPALRAASRGMSRALGAPRAQRHPDGTVTGYVPEVR